MFSVGRLRTVQLPKERERVYPLKHLSAIVCNSSEVSLYLLHTSHTDIDASVTRLTSQTLYFNTRLYL